MLLFTVITLFLQFQGLECQVTTPAPMPTTAVSLAEKVLAVQRIMYTGGTIDFQVAPCAFLLNGPLPGENGEPGPDPASASGDQVCVFIS
jgi:hypothetical protein